MNISIQISESDYNLLINGRRMKGSIELTGTKKGNFRCYRQKPASDDLKFIRLSHGRVSVNSRRVRMSLLVDLKESVVPGNVIWDDCWCAKKFVEKHFMNGGEE